MDFCRGAANSRSCKRSLVNAQGMPFLAEKSHLIFGDRESTVRQAHAALEKKAAKRIGPAKSAVDLGVQRTDENESEPRHCAQQAQDVKPGGPSIDNDVVGPLRPQHPDQAWQSAQRVEGESGIEGSAGADTDSFPSDSVGLAGVRGDDDDFVPARNEFFRKERNLKFCSAGSAL